MLLAYMQYLKFLASPLSRDACAKLNYINANMCIPCWDANTDSVFDMLDNSCISSKYTSNPLFNNYSLSTKILLPDSQPCMCFGSRLAPPNDKIGYEDLDLCFNNRCAEEPYLRYELLHLNHLDKNKCGLKFCGKIQKWVTEGLKPEYPNEMNKQLLFDVCGINYTTDGGFCNIFVLLNMLFVTFIAGIYILSYSYKKKLGRKTTMTIILAFTTLLLFTSFVVSYVFAGKSFMKYTTDPPFKNKCYTKVGNVEIPLEFCNFPAPGECAPDTFLSDNLQCNNFNCTGKCIPDNICLPGKDQINPRTELFKSLPYFPYIISVTTLLTMPLIIGIFLNYFNISDFKYKLLIIIIIITILLIIPLYIGLGGKKYVQYENCENK